MLVAIIGLAILYREQTGQYSFDLAQLAELKIPAQLGLWLFLAFALAFAIKVPVFPLHAWLPDAYTQAPTAVLVLATMLVKVGGYGFLRFGLALFPGEMAANAPLFLTAGVIGVVYARADRGGRRRTLSGCWPTPAWPTWHSSFSASSP